MNNPNVDIPNPFFYGKNQDKNNPNNLRFPYGINLLLKVIEVNDGNDNIQEFQNNNVFKPYMASNLIQVPPPTFIYQPRFPNIMDSCKNLPLSINHDQHKKETTIKRTKHTRKKLNSRKPKTSSYKRRNVYKSVIRHMLSYSRKNKSEIRKMLESNGFLRSDINKAFEYFSHLSELEREKGSSKRPQRTINDILETKSIYTYILKESLESMMKELEIKGNGKIMRKNINIYIDVCKKYHARCAELIN